MFITAFRHYMGQIMYKQIAVKNELKNKNELRDKSLAESANSWQASPIFSYNSLSVWNLLSDAIPLVVHDLAHDQGNIATFRTPITFEFQSTHIEFAWRSTSTTYMFLLLAQISNLFSLNILPLAPFLMFSWDHEKLRNSHKNKRVSWWDFWGNKIVSNETRRNSDIFIENFSLFHKPCDNMRKEDDQADNQHFFS